MTKVNRIKRSTVIINTAKLSEDIFYEFHGTMSLKILSRKLVSLILQTVV